MNADQNGDARGKDCGVLRWHQGVLAAEDLSRYLDGQREIELEPRTVITPLAAEWLRARSVRITHRRDKSKPTGRGATWGVAQEHPNPVVEAAVKALARQVQLRGLPHPGDFNVCRWAKLVAELVVQGECIGAMAFCAEPALVSGVANKMPGVRAVTVGCTAEARRLIQAFGANVLAVGMASLTFFQVRQLIDFVCSVETIHCPAEVAEVLIGLECHEDR
jgi:ribose 5-phosphate isomerase RpiB